MDTTDSTTKVKIPTEEERQRFIRDVLQPLRHRPEVIADIRYTGDWGTYSKDPTKSDWQVRQANRYLTEIDRRRELWPVTLGIWVGVSAVVVAILAMPLRDSILCRLLAWLGAGVCARPRNRSVSSAPTGAKQRTACIAATH